MTAILIRNGLKSFIQLPTLISEEVLRKTFGLWKTEDIVRTLDLIKISAITSKTKSIDIWKDKF